MKITHWTIKVTWEDGQEEYLDDVPHYVAREVDDFLDELQGSQEEIDNEEPSCDNKEDV